MFRRHLTLVLAATALLFATIFPIGTTFAGSGARELVFKGSLQAVENDVFDLPTIYIHGIGSGKATQLGQFTVRYDGIAHRENGVGISDLATQFVAENGDSIYAKASGRGIPSETPGVNKIVELYTITGGTGRFADASGSFTVERLLTLSTGVTSGEIDGNIVLPEPGVANDVLISTPATVPHCDMSSSAAHVRSEIPDGFVQPVVPCDAIDLLDVSVPPTGPHTVRDVIPPEFIQPVAY